MVGKLKTNLFIKIIHTIRDLVVIKLGTLLVAESHSVQLERTIGVNYE